jgi:hypothetical protein
MELLDQRGSMHQHLAFVPILLQNDFERLSEEYFFQLGAIVEY